MANWMVVCTTITEMMLGSTCSKVSVQDRNKDHEMINRLLLVLAAVCAITAPCVHAEPAREYSLTDLLRLGGQVIAANESHIWVFVESLRNNDHEFYICSYNKDEPQAGSICCEVT